MQAKTTQKRSNESIIAPIFIKPLPKKSDQDVSTRTPIRSKESLKSSNGSVVYKPATNSKPAPKLKPTTRPTSSKNSIKPSSRPTSAKKQSRPTTPKTNTIKRGNILKRDSIQVTPDQRTSVIKPTERSPISHHQSTIPQIAPAVEKKSGSELSSADWTLLEACSTGNLMQVYNSLWAGLSF